MVERKIVVDELEVSYNGLLNIKELYRLIDKFLDDKGYDKMEKVNKEVVTPKGKDIFVVLTPVKFHTDYIRKGMEIEIAIRGVNEVETEIDKRKVRLHQGNVHILFSGYLDTDWEGRWERTPFYYFLKTVFDKFVYKRHTQDFEAEVTDDVNQLKDQVGALLNLYKHRVSS